MSFEEVTFSWLTSQCKEVFSLDPISELLIVQVDSPLESVAEQVLMVFVPVEVRVGIVPTIGTS